MKKKILISGAGVAGLMTALLLDKEKYDVHVIERADKFVNIGFSIILWKSGYKTLEKVIGVGSLKNFYPINSVSMYGGSDIEFLHSANSEGVGHSVERKELIDVLSSEYIKKFGMSSITFGQSVKDVSYDDGRAYVAFSDGTHKQYDLIIASDGIHSGVRDTHFKSTKITAPYTITYEWIKPGAKLKDEAIIGFMKGTVFLIHTVGDRALLGYYNRSDKGQNKKFINSLSGFVTRDKNGEFEVEKGTARNFKSETISVKKSFDRSIVLLGDALHGHPPTLAMGTSMAIEDAELLAMQLNGLGDEDFSTSLKSKLNYYHKKRKTRVREVYGFQDFSESLFITNSSVQAEFIKRIYKHGGWVFFESWFRRLVSK